MGILAGSFFRPEEKPFSAPADRFRTPSPTLSPIAPYAKCFSESQRKPGKYCTFI
jgi:hypothetical protein